MSWGQRPWRRDCQLLAAPRERKRTTGTPRPRRFHRVEAGLLARGSSLPSGLPGLTPSGADGRWLTAHSCGGSAGIVAIAWSLRTGFPLGSEAQRSPENLDKSHYGHLPNRCQHKYKEMLISLYTAWGWSVAANDAPWPAHISPCAKEAVYTFRSCNTPKCNFQWPAPPFDFDLTLVVTDPARGAGTPQAWRR